MVQQSDHPRRPPARLLHIDAGNARRFARDVVLSPTRKRPIVALTTAREAGGTWIDPEDLAIRLEGRATVVVIPTGEATWALTEALPDMLDVYGGAVRIWWPGASEDSEPRDHPLMFARSTADGDRVFHRVVEAICPPPPAPLTPWQRVAREYAVGDVVWGLVQGVKDFGAFVELLPGVRGIVPKGEIDWTFVTDVAEFVKPGEQVAVQIVSMDALQKRATLSIKRAWNRTPRPPIAATEGGRPLMRDEAPTSTDADMSQDLAAAVGDLQGEIDTLREGRSDALRRLQEAQKELRGARDRIAYLERQPGTGEDVLDSETAFLLGVRMAYARLFGEGERHGFPLRRMRVGPEFLERLRALDGVAVEKVLEVCAHVAANRAHEIPGREVHRLKPPGRPGVERARDGAKAWRCSLQDSTASARRLHWWSIPGEGGGAVEFASVGVHDDYAMPE